MRRKKRNKLIMYWGIGIVIAILIFIFVKTSFLNVYPPLNNSNGSIGGIQQVSDSCYLTATQNNYQFYNSPITTSNQCSNSATIDCNNRNKATNGIAYNDVIDCCVWNCKEKEVIQPTHTCTDTDGGDNKDVPGTVTYDGTDKYMDFCFDAITVYEYRCFADNTWGGRKISCDAGQTCLSSRSGGYCRTRTWNNGDIVYDSGNVGNDLLAGNPGLSIRIDLSDLPPTSELGGCKLQARIQTDWGYITPSTCSGLQGMEGMYFSFYDSSGKVWERTDTQPLALGSLTQCGLIWDGQNPWSFNFNKLLNLPGCSIGLDYKVEVVICGC